jgi:hypothetical protein
VDLSGYPLMKLTELHTGNYFLCNGLHCDGVLSARNQFSTICELVLRQRFLLFRVITSFHRKIQIASFLLRPMFHALVLQCRSYSLLENKKKQEGSFDFLFSMCISNPNDAKFEKYVTKSNDMSQ